MASKAETVTGRWRGMAMLRWLDALRQREDRILLILSLVVGVLTGLAVVAFILLTERLGLRLYPMGSPAWRRVLIPMAGSLGMGYLLWRFFPDARGSGVPQTKAAMFARDGVITGGTIFGKFFCTAATLASGIPLGREGPSVQVGAGIASVLGRRLGLRPASVKALIPIGAAAAIAAAFNTPLAAVLFSLEEIMGDLNAPVLGSVVLASATSWLVLRLLLGNNPLFQAPQYQLVHPVEFALYAVLGVAGGLVSVAFTKLLLATRKYFLQLPRWTAWFQPLAGGVVTGLMAWKVPQLLGVGYGYVGDALNNHMVWKLMAILLLFKLVSVATSYGSGNAGGIFGPSLFMGAMLGGTLGGVAHHLWPAYTAQPGAYALVGMGALFAGVVRAPMTSVVMIFETTRDYAVIVPLMIANLVSFFLSSRLQKEPIYEALAIQDGIHLPGGVAQRRQGQRQVTQVMRATTNWIAPEMPLANAVDEGRGKEFHTFLVGDGKKLTGVVSLKEMEQALAQGESQKSVGDLIVGVKLLDFPHVHADHGLYVALERMGAAGLDFLPVVSRANVQLPLGIVAIEDVLASYGVPGRDKPQRQVTKGGAAGDT
jgi:chloride channel protein, CIC family